MTTSQSAACLPIKSDTPIKNGNEPILFDLLDAEAAARDISNWPNDPNVKKLAGKILTLCTGPDFEEVRDHARKILAHKSEDLRGYHADRIADILQPLTTPSKNSTSLPT